MSASLGLFIAGAFCFLLIFFLPDQTHPLALLGGTVCDAAFFKVLRDSYANKEPLPTRGGRVTYEESPRMYKFVHGFLAFVGVFFLIVISVNAFSRWNSAGCGVNEATGCASSTLNVI
jgi:hypothetical protein